MPRDIETTADLLIGQWEGSPKIRGLAEIFRDMMVEDVIPALEEIRLMRQIESAAGVHLDYLGRRLGVERPASTDPAQDLRFGFDAAGQGFDQVPFSGDTSNDAVFPLPDGVYRRFLRGRAIALLSDGTFQTLVRSVRAIDGGAAVQDRRDMTVRVVTSRQSLIELADASGCLARNAGVLLTFAQRGRFGFDEAGVPFDQGPFSTET